jgi:hypothetical protein
VSSRRPLAVIVGIVIAAAYAWLATGAHPFTRWAYIAVSIPVVVTLAFYARRGGFREPEATNYYRRRSLGAMRNATLWWALFVAALATEIAGLTLGGRSKDVPTLSTTVDHLLVEHWARWLLFLWWLWIGARAVKGISQRRGEKNRS